MRYKINRKLLCLASLMLAPLSAFSAPTVKFEGEITAQTCSVGINGITNSVVLLPSVAARDFGATLTTGQTTGLTPFTVSVSGCTAPTTSAQLISTNFLGYNVDQTTGVLGNTASGTDSAVGYGIQLTSDKTGTSPLTLNGLTRVSGLSLSVGSTDTTHDFGAQYYVIDAKNARAGKLTAVAEYSVSYL